MKFKFEFEIQKGKENLKLNKKEKNKEKGMAYWAQSHVFGPLGKLPRAAQVLNTTRALP
jgi:hypothetical protein